jgi:hypothetical protein
MPTLNDLDFEIYQANQKQWLERLSKKDKNEFFLKCIAKLFKIKINEVEIKHLYNFLEIYVEDIYSKMIHLESYEEYELCLNYYIIIELLTDTVNNISITFMGIDIEEDLIQIAERLKEKVWNTK